MYDALAWKWAHQAQSREEIIERLPPLDGSEVTGGYHYFDAQTDDARLVLRVLREAVRHGGTALNYARVQKLLRTRDGRVRGVVVSDLAPGASRTAEVTARVVINATGAWADDLRGAIGQAKRLRRIRGSHLTFAADRLPLSEAVSLLGSGKTPIAEYFADKGFWPSAASDVMATVSGKYTDMITAPHTGTIAGTASSYTIVATMKSSAVNTFIAGKTLQIFTADSGKIPELSLLKIRYGLPWLLDDNGKGFVMSLLKREIRIDGLVRIPPTPFKTAKAALDLVRLTRILSVNS
jgi:glycine/D-amino acid oxidase-like deaminating enzyme